MDPGLAFSRVPCDFRPMMDPETTTDVFLQAGRDKRIGAGHPWVYANEVRMDADAKAIPPGTPVRLCRVDGKPLALGTFNAHALICFRAFAHAEEPGVDRELITDRLRHALALRARFFDAPYYRAVHGEADGLPGLVVDRMGDVVVAQLSTAGTEALREPILAAIDEVLRPTAVVLRNDGAGRRLEGLADGIEVVKGSVNGPVEVQEGERRLLADPLGGQKTGWFFDQRGNREFVAGLCDGARVLDLYAYAGPFAIAAVAVGAREVLAIDRSGPALDLVRECAAQGGYAPRLGIQQGDAFEALETMGSTHDTFDVAFCDPPAFAKSKREVGPAVRGYRKLARMAARVVSPGGLLALSSCSHNVTSEAFLEASARGIHRAGRGARLIRQAGAGPDHPIHPMLPESAYLKSLVFQLD